MSYTTILQLWPNTELEAQELMELSNSWGFAIPVWQALSMAYCNKEMKIWEDLDYLWKLYKRVDIPLAHRAVLCMTFDNAYVGRADYGLAAGHIREYLRGFPPEPGNVDHWETIIDVFDSIPNCHAIGFWATSVSDSPFLGPYNEETDGHDPFDWESAADVYRLLEEYSG